MALFGKKKQDAPAPNAEPDIIFTNPTAGADPQFAAGAPADADLQITPGAVPGAAPDVAVAKGRKAKTPKAPKEPKAARGGVKSGTIVGLNIGNAFIKAVEVTSKGGQLSVTGIGVVQTPPESYSNGNVLSVSALAGALRTLWKGAGFNTKATVLSVAGTGSLVVRVIEVPRMTDGELQDNMRVDADRYIPFPPSEVVMDFKALRELPTDPDAPNMEVLLAAAQREIIDLHVGVVQKARLDPRAIDVEPIALARALQLETRALGQMTDYDEVTAVLNIGETGTEISILRGDIVVFTRSVPNGGGQLTSAIAETLGLPPSDAERLKIESGDALPPAGYGQGAEQDDFGFGDFDDGTGGDVDFGDFGDSTGVATQTATASAPATGSATASGTAGSDDPFDLDFFNQGPPQAEPGAGHGQKEDDEDEDKTAPGISFSFDSLDDDLTPSRASATPAPVVAAPASAPPTPVPPAPPSLENFDLPDDYLPAVTTPLAPNAPPSATAASGGADSGGADSGGADSGGADSGGADSGVMASAFDFSDFDLPTSTPATSTPATATPSALPVAATVAPTQKLSADTPVAPVAPTAASFGFSPTFDDEAAPAPISLQKTDETDAPTVDAIAGAPSAVAPDIAAPIAAPVVETATDDDFDLDDIFGGAPATAATAAAPIDANFDSDAMDFGASGADFDVSALDAGADDFSSFGSGLSQTGDTDALSLYNAIQPVLDDLATEVRRSLEFHLGRYPDTTFSRLILVGGGARLRNLDAFLTENLGVPTTVGDPFSHISINCPRLPAEFAPTNSALCAVALGLALRDFIE